MLDDSAVILLAEDNSVIRMLLDEVFEDEGYALTSCRSAAEAIQTLQHITPVLVISDMRMEHGFAGLQILTHLRKQAHTRAVPVIIYSADSFLLDTLQPKIVELNGVAIGKPFDIDDLVKLALSLINPKEHELG